MRVRPLPLSAALTLALLLLATSLSALVPPSGPSWAGKAGVQYREAVLDPDPQARVLALAILFPAGSIQDPRGGEGTAFLLGRLLERQGNRVLIRYGASLRIEVSPEEFLITLVSAPNEWREAVTGLDELLYREGLSAPDLESAREELLEVLAFETGAPGRIFERESAIFLLGATHPAARPLRGTPASVGSVTTPDLEAFRSLYLRAEEGVFAGNGPVRAEELSSVLSDSVRDLGEGGASVISVAAADSLAPAPVLRLYRSAPPTLEVPSSPLGPPAWTTGLRVLMDRELTSTWISIAFPFPLGTPELLLDFVGHLIIEDLTPTPPGPGPVRSACVANGYPRRSGTRNYRERQPPNHLPLGRTAQRLPAGVGRGPSGRSILRVGAPEIPLVRPLGVSHPRESRDMAGPSGRFRGRPDSRPRAGHLGLAADCSC